MGSFSSKPGEAKPTTPPHGSTNANGHVFGIWTPGTRGSNPGAK